MSERLKALLEVYYNRMAERAEGNAWLNLINSGWFQQYSGYAGADAEVEAEGTAVSFQSMEAQMNQRRSARVPQPSDVQVVNQGGSETSEDGVTISKTIQGTDLENVFDITLQVSTPRDILEVSNGLSGYGCGYCDGYFQYDDQWFWWYDSLSGGYDSGRNVSGSVCGEFHFSGNQQGWVCGL